MARARNIKPSFFTNDELGDVNPLARLLFIGMWTIADFKGCFEYKPKRLKVQLLPYDDCDIEELVTDLEKSGFISKYTVQGRQYIKALNFTKHQNPHKNERESGSEIPDIDQADQELSKNNFNISNLPNIENNLEQDGTDRGDIQQARALLAAPKGEREGLSTQFGESNAMSDNDNALLNEQDSLKAKLAQGEILTLEYNKRIEDAVRIHEESKFKIQEEYAQKYQDLQQSQRQTQLELYGSLLSQASTVWGSMTEMVKNSAGEQSSAYKAMFLMQQAIAIGQAIISTELAATKALELGPVLGIPASTLVRGMGYASVGLIAAQTIAGFANGGQIRGAGTNTSDSIPIMASHEEFMIKAKSAKKIGLDNLNYMNRTGELPNREMNQFNAINSGGSFERKEPKVIIINQTSEKVDATSEWDGKELTVILKEYQKQNEAMVDAKIEKRFRMSKRQGW
ncbi:hypothetical protein V6W86_06470 [Acinetobacter baumannii]|uniref:hypothetical protein n=1 Tax=Acinetobacter baumannii TaxID=470 RepID=UPI002FE59B84